MIDKLEMFIALAQARHFGRAAEAVGVAQPTLSAAIRQLEESLGVMLVRRGSRYGGLTPEGERVLQWARRIVSDARTMREEIRIGSKGLSGTLRLAVIPTALAVASRLTASFAQSHPDVRLTILSATSISILEDLDGLRIDVGISYLDNEPLGTKTTLPLYEERYTLILREDHPLASRDRIAWGELRGVPLCLLTPDMQNRRIIGGLLGQAGVPVAPRVETNSTIVLVTHVLADNWATILPRSAAEFFLSHGPLRAIPLAEPDAGHLVGLIVPAREPQMPLVAALLSEARRFSSRENSDR
ncbi:Hydrogen peroxide-inducible activator [Rubellimicrobium mesophilum DSM 19309]|uniref:Hydrogen peroxide-inducible activator n=1 Tax=Rubellimicrobium mesophilum DSM 19309 TaxID=442562 RepID=A0A017HP48_9RHOB|nr:LysR family transcriptional regulator [Rubellimicrobium mesophilum]EYD76287.1 Hydrogen peroxide-inducible activator [Rubellimicrobium mesophilum DSM 19309]